MANIIAYLIGALALILALPALIPFLGWFNWLILVIAGVGAVIGQISSRNGGRNFCLIVMVLCALRLWVGGGLI